MYREQRKTKNPDLIPRSSVGIFCIKTPGFDPLRVLMELFVSGIPPVNRPEFHPSIFIFFRPLSKSDKLQYICNMKK